MDANLIFDLGMHRGEDTELYLKKGFRVVAVDADAELCEQARARFADDVAAGRLTVVHNAIADVAGTVTLYRNTELSIWNTIDPEFAQRNDALGTGSVAVAVEAVTLDTLLDRFGMPYYLKVDIEGMDLAAVQAVAARAERPRYVSLESSKVSFAALEREFDVLAGLGYGSFKLVPQHEVESQVPPRPALEGTYAAHRFPEGASGLFGEEAPGRWLSRDEAIDAYRAIFRRYALVGDAGRIRSRRLKQLLWRAGYRAGWYDTHARLAD